MSVLIKGKEMPKSCFHCYLCNFGDCKLLPNIIVVKNWVDKTLSEKCPIVPVPTPHGRLIDADKLLDSFGKGIDEDNHFVNFFSLVESAPTIIEAEVSDNA